jgi:ATP-dependent DNA helicase
VNYKIEENDSKYIRDLENGKAKREPSGVTEKSAAEQGKDWSLKQASECRPFFAGQKGSVPVAGMP